MEKSEESLVLRRNPLNIRASDGSDIVVGKAPRYGKPEMHESQPNKAFSATPEFAHSSDALSADHSNDSIPTAELDDQLTELSIGTALSAEDPPHITPLSPERVRMRSSESMDLSGVDLDFGKDISTDLGGFLSRKNTIALRSKATAKGADVLPKTRSGPSPDKQLIQRLRSIRKRLSSDSLPQVPDADVDDDARRAECLPNDVLQMIAFSPDSPWLGSEIQDSASDDEGENEDENENIVDPGAASNGVQEAKPTNSKAQLSEGELETSNSAELNPFRMSRETTPESAVHDASSVVTPASQISDYNPPRETRAPASPRIEETDPVKPEDRGRLFLQVNKLANVRGLPIDPARHPRFTLLLDNGIQTVTTEPAPLPSAGFNGLLTAKIGQEFELVVAQDLELVVTINVHMDALQPPPRPSAPRIARHAPTSSVASAQTANSKENAGTASVLPVKGMRNLLRSPKKKQNEKFKRQQQEREREEQHELELLEKEQQAQEEVRKRYEHDLTDFHRRADTWRNITGPGGEYCRGYLFESHYERDIYGRAKSFALPLYNEWDKASNGVPKPVCDLQITMMYVPKLYGSEHIPMSMKECQQALRAAAEKRSVGVQGFLTQQGGDCANIWRRRWFTLQEAEMIGHHEATRKRRALIHLENAVAIKDTVSDDLWCIYEDRSFEISFDDGEALSFYADSVEERNRWVAALRSSLANCTGRHRAWTDLILEQQAGPTPASAPTAKN